MNSQFTEIKKNICYIFNKIGFVQLVLKPSGTLDFKINYREISISLCFASLNSGSGCNFL